MDKPGSIPLLKLPVRIAKSLMISSIAFTGVVFAGAPSLHATGSIAGPAAVEMAVEIADGDDALARSKPYGIIPEEATIISNGLNANGDSWLIQYFYSGDGNKVREGSIQLNALNGELVSVAESLNKNGLYGDPMAPPFDPALEKIAFSEAVSLALQYADAQSWSFGQEWMPTVKRESDYSVRDIQRNLHAIPLNLAYQNGRHSDKLYVWVDRLTGKVAGHQLTWTKTNFIIPEDMGTYQEAAQKIGNLTETVLLRTEGSQILAYGLRLTDETWADRAVEDVAGVYYGEAWADRTVKGVAGAYYGEALAKKRLLALYELETVYRNDGKGNAIAAYDLALKQDVPLFYSGTPPFIDAQTGEWIDYLGNPESRPLPAASEWLVDWAVPSGTTGYKAAIVWNNELLRLNNEPLIENGTTLVPFRELLAQLGAAIFWDAVNLTVTARQNGHEIKLTIGSPTAYINGKAEQLGAPAILRDGRTYIPARVVLETFGAVVGWDKDSRFVLVNTDASLPKPTGGELKQLRFEAYLNWAEKN